MTIDPILILFASLIIWQYATPLNVQPTDRRALSIADELIRLLNCSSMSSWSCLMVVSSFSCMVSSIKVIMTSETAFVCKCPCLRFTLPCVFHLCNKHLYMYIKNINHFVWRRVKDNAWRQIDSKSILKSLLTQLVWLSLHDKVASISQCRD